MSRYLIDSSALWRILRDRPLRDHWTETVELGGIACCPPQRVEFRRSARNLREYDEMNEMFVDLYPEVPVPKGAWQWIESAQYRLARDGHLRSLSTVDLLICATAAHHGLIVLHDDNDFRVAARSLPDVAEHPVHSTPGRS